MSYVILLVVAFYLAVLSIELMFLANGYEEARAKGFIAVKDFGDWDTTSNVTTAIGLSILLGFAVTLRLRQLVMPSASRW